MLQKARFNLTSFQSPPRTKTTLFLGPMLDPIIRRIKSRFRFLNVYLGDNTRPQHKEALYILCHPIYTKEYVDFERLLCAHDLHIETYDVMPGLTMHVFAVPPQYLEDYYHYLEGAYTKLSNNYKIKFIKGTNLHKIVHGKINYPIWDENLEIFNLKQITKKWKQE